MLVAGEDLAEYRTHLLPVRLLDLIYATLSRQRPETREGMRRPDLQWHQAGRREGRIVLFRPALSEVSRCT